MNKLFLLALLAAATGCKKEDPNDVHFQVDCPNARVFYDDQNGETHTAVVHGTWRTDFEGRDGQYLYLHAQNLDSFTTVSATILVGSKTIANPSHTGLDWGGALGTVTATGNVP